MFRPNSAGVFPSTTTALLRLTKNDRLRTSKPTLIYIHVLTSIHTHVQTHSIKIHASVLLHHLRPLLSQTLVYRHTDTSVAPISPPKGDCISAQRLTREWKYTLVILISPQLTLLFNDLNPHARCALLLLLLFIVFPVKATNGNNTTIMQLYHQWLWSISVPESG